MKWKSHQKAIWLWWSRQAQPTCSVDRSVELQSCMSCGLNVLWAAACTSDPGAWLQHSISSISQQLVWSSSLLEPAGGKEIVCLMFLPTLLFLFCLFACSCWQWHSNLTVNITMIFYLVSFQHVHSRYLFCFFIKSFMFEVIWVIVTHTTHSSTHLFSPDTWHVFWPLFFHQCFCIYIAAKLTLQQKTEDWRQVGGELMAQDASQVTQV